MKRKHARPMISAAMGAAAGLALGLLAAPAAVTAGTIVGSPHDFSGKGWSGGEICVACHTPHGADTSVSEAPLWNHALTTKTFTVYSSGTLDSTVGQPDGISKLCLSCHDGSVALDSFGGNTGTSFMTGKEAVGADELNNDHPISMVFDTALSTTDPGLHDPATQSVTIGEGTQTRTGTVQQLMLSANKVQCSSCHDVHNTFTIGGNNGKPLLKVTKAGSQLCLTCHKK